MIVHDVLSRKRYFNFFVWSVKTFILGHTWSMASVVCLIAPTEHFNNCNVFSNADSTHSRNHFHTVLNVNIFLNVFVGVQCFGKRFEHLGAAVWVICCLLGLNTNQTQNFGGKHGWIMVRFGGKSVLGDELSNEFTFCQMCFKISSPKKSSPTNEPHNAHGNDDMNKQTTIILGWNLFDCQFLNLFKI